MRLSERRATRAGIAAVGALTLMSLACKDSNAVTAPVSSPMGAANVAGSWTGTFESDSSACASSQLTATFVQSGYEVTGTLSGTSCGTSGVFRGSVNGNELTGKIEMLGCSGGAVSATVSGAGLQLTMGDLTRPIVSGPEVVLYGGSASLRR